jgi:hypothetical protein
MRDSSELYTRDPYLSNHKARQGHIDCHLQLLVPCGNTQGSVSMQVIPPHPQTQHWALLGIFSCAVSTGEPMRRLQG